MEYQNDSPSDNCPDCGASPGEHHVPDCDVEQCPYCGTQLISCSCEDDPPGDDRLPWTGTWPGVEECREYGWYSRRGPGGWEPCGPDVAGDVTEDLNRLRREAVWDRMKKRFIHPKADF